MNLPKLSTLTPQHKTSGALAKSMWDKWKKAPDFVKDGAAWEASKSAVLAKHSLQDTDFWNLVCAVYEDKVATKMPILAAINTDVSELPAEFQYLPGGVHTIKASRAGQPVKLSVRVTPKTVAALNASLAQLNEERAPQKVYFDFDHKAEAAAFWPHSFQWKEQPAPGVYVAGEWSEEGVRKVKGKTYRAFSPSFFPDRDPVKTSEQDPAEIIGMDFVGGGLVNKPAFRRIAPLWCTEPDDKPVVQASERGLEEIRREVQEAMAKSSDYCTPDRDPNTGAIAQCCWLRDVLVGEGDEPLYAIIQLPDGKLVRQEIVWVDDNDEDGDSDVEFVGEAEPTRQVYASECDEVSVMATWSDASREAALAARRAKMQGGTEKADADTLSGQASAASEAAGGNSTIETRRAAAAAHEQAAKAHHESGNKDKAAYHALAALDEHRLADKHDADATQSGKKFISGLAKRGAEDTTGFFGTTRDKSADAHIGRALNETGETEVEAERYLASRRGRHLADFTNDSKPEEVRAYVKRDFGKFK